MSNDKPKTKAQKVIGIILNVLTYLFFAICLIALVLSVAAKRDVDGAVNLWGKQMRVVVSDSMAKSDQTDVSGYEIKDIPIKSMLFIDLVPEDEKEAEEWYASLKVGDVLTFRYVHVQQETITHRITEITKEETGGYIIELEGDNKASDANTLTQTMLLAGLKFCGYCGEKMTSFQDKSKTVVVDGEEKRTYIPKYRCRSVSYPTETPCQGQSTYSAKKVERVVIDALKKYISTLNTQDLSVSYLERVEEQIRVARNEAACRPNKNGKGIECLKRRGCKISYRREQV